MTTLTECNYMPYLDDDTGATYCDKHAPKFSSKVNVEDVDGERCAVCDMIFTLDEPLAAT